MTNKLCNCGCGKLAPIAKYSSKRFGWKLNQPKNFIHGHNRRGVKWNLPPMLGKKHTVATRKKMYLSSRKGKDSNLWRGGVYQKNELMRRSSEYKLWRKAVFERDDWTCVICLTKGGELNADHVKPWASYPELRFAIDNGRTLCVECHKKTPTYAVNLRYAAEIVKGWESENTADR